MNRAIFTRLTGLFGPRKRAAAGLAILQKGENRRASRPLELFLGGAGIRFGNSQRGKSTWNLASGRPAKTLHARVPKQRVTCVRLVRGRKKSGPFSESPINKVQSPSKKPSVAKNVATTAEISQDAFWDAIAGRSTASVDPIKEKEIFEEEAKDYPKPASKPLATPGDIGKVGIESTEATKGARKPASKYRKVCSPKILFPQSAF